ncbi:MAG: DUF3568 family protein [Planctomycetota bacterium]|jgi:hypothetical protein
MLVKQISIVFVLAGLVLAASGCAPSFVGTDASVYSGGKLYAVASRDLTSIYNATLRALGDLEIEVTKKAKDVFYGKVVAKGADGKTITIRLEPEGNLTNLSIKVGLLGNRAKASVIYERIKLNLEMSSK